MHSKKQITSFGIAELAEVSQTTVSRALRGDRGYPQALRTRGITPDDTLQVDAENSRRSGSKATETLPARGVPFEVVAAGFDDIPMASFVNPPLTTVQQDTKLAGDMLVDGLLRLIQNEPVESRMLPMKLIVRRSSLWQGLTDPEQLRKD